MPSPAGQRGSNMAPSPMSSANTPQMQGEPHQPGSQEDQQYLDKIRQLSIYIEPLREMIAGIGDGDQNKLDKMKKLMDILSNPNKRMPMETLLKCEKVLEKMTFNMDPKASSKVDSTSSINPLLESIIKLLNTHSQSEELNHTLERSFGAPLEAIYGSDISLSPLPPKRRKNMTDESDRDSSEDEDDSGLPLVLQKEISMLEAQYKVTTEQQSAEVGEKTKGVKGRSSVNLFCHLEDANLPSVPPLSVCVPQGYPDEQPSLVHASGYTATPFLRRVEEALRARMDRMPEMFTLTQMLVAWEMAVRAACSPKQIKVTAQAMVMGL